MIDGVDEGRGFVGLSFNMCYFSKDKRIKDLRQDSASYGLVEYPMVTKIK